MKILIVVHTFFPKYLGGTEVCVSELSSRFQKKGDQVKILTTDPLSDSNTYQSTISTHNNIEVVTINKDIRKYSSFKETYKDDKTLKSFRNIIKEFQPDVIHYHHLMHLSLDYIKIAKDKNIPQVVTLHDFWFQCLTHQRVTTSGKLCQSFDSKKCTKCLSDILNAGPIVNTTFSLNGFINDHHKIEYLKNISNKLISRLQGKILYQTNLSKYQKLVLDRNDLIKKSLSQVDLVIYPTKFLANEFKKWGLKTKTEITSSDGINTLLFKDFKRNKSNTIRFGYIGSIIPNKGLDMVLKAWPKLVSGSYNLKIYGNLLTDKKYSSYIQNLSKGLKNIEFCGNFPFKDISKIYSNIDVLIVPSRWFENAPLVLRNALQTGTSVIATNLGSMPELIKHNVNGFLYENENVNDLAKLMNHVIKNKAILMRMENEAIPQKSIEDNANELLTYYKKLNKNDK